MTSPSALADYKEAEDSYLFFYQPEISNERCAEYINGNRPRPYEVLEKTIRDTASARAQVKPGKAVLFWFKRDLRLFDNRGLSSASEFAIQHGLPLVAIFIASPQDYQAHLTSKIRIDFEFRTLHIIKADLAKLNIPLLVEIEDLRINVPQRLLGICQELGAKHLFCNTEYEVDELRRETSLIHSALKEGIDFRAQHDDVIVVPRLLWKGQNKQNSVFSPYNRAWVRHVEAHAETLKASHIPHENTARHSESLSKYFDRSIPEPPLFVEADQAHLAKIRSLWPAGEHEARRRLMKFLDERVSRYRDERNDPSAQATAIVSVHHSVGTLSVRTSVREAIARSGHDNLAQVSASTSKWISEIAWRDFYKYIIAYWPYVCMNKGFKYETTSEIEWEDNDEHFAAWCDGRTGFPIVDAAMRQMLQTGYMHNRCRMTAASFLAFHLLIDWRRGERFFMTRLIDGDFASNNGGWGFSASVGVDPQPFLRIMNPLLQSNKFDEHGEYIKKWCPELREVPEQAISDPYGRGYGHVARANGYPEPIVDHKAARLRAIERYRMGRGGGDDHHNRHDTSNGATLVSPRKSDSKSTDVQISPLKRAFDKSL